MFLKSTQISAYLIKRHLSCIFKNNSENLYHKTIALMHYD